MAGKQANPMAAVKYGEWAFLLGVVLSVLIGVLSSYLGGYIIYAICVLAVLGLIVGFMNISDKETTAFLIAAIALLAIPNILTSLAATLSLASMINAQVGLMIVSWFGMFFTALGAFVAPAALIVALKQIYDLAKQ